MRPGSWPQLFLGKTNKTNQIKERRPGSNKTFGKTNKSNKSNFQKTCRPRDLLEVPRPACPLKVVFVAFVGFPEGFVAPRPPLLDMVGFVGFPEEKLRPGARPQLFLWKTNQTTIRRARPQRFHVALCLCLYRVSPLSDKGAAGSLIDQVSNCKNH